VKSTLGAAGLVVLTEYPNAKLPDDDFGLIDHIAVTSAIAERRPKLCVWGKTNDQNERLSDHPGVVVDLAFDR
jgi:hypothetical protein